MSFFDTLTKKLGFQKEERKTSNPLLTNLSSSLNKSSRLNEEARLKRPVVEKDLLKNVNSIVEPIASVGRAVITRPIRFAAQSFQDIGGYLGDPDYEPKPFVAKTPVEQAAFGKEPIYSAVGYNKKLKKEADEIKMPIKDAEGNVLFRGVNPKLATTMAVLGSFAPLGDILPGGGEKNKVLSSLLKGPLDELIQASIKSSDDVASFNILKESGISDDIARETAPKITLAKNPQQAETIIREAAAKEIQVTKQAAINRIEELSNKQKGIQIIKETGEKVPTQPAFLTADELDEFTFLNANKNKPENIILANRSAEIGEETARGLKEGTVRVSPKSVDYGLDPALVSRINVNDPKIVEMVKDIKAGNDKFMPPVPVYEAADGKLIINKDGAHRLTAYREAGKDMPIRVESKTDLTSTAKQTLERQRATDNIRQMEEMKALDTARGGVKERKYITSAKASEDIASDISKEINEVYNTKSNKELVSNSVKRVDDNFEEAKKFANENSTDEAVATRVAVDKELTQRYLNAATDAEKKVLAEELKDSLIQHARLATEEGRTVQANALLGKTTPEGMLRTTSKIIDKYNKGAKNKIPQITGKDIEFVLNEGKKIEGMADGLAKDQATKKLADYLQSLIPSPWWKKLTTVWKAGLLTGIKTSGINLSSSFFNGVAETVKDLPATGIDLASSLFTGQRTKSFTLRGLGQGSVEGIKKGWDYLKTGVAGQAGDTALEFSKVHFDSKPGKILEKYAEGVFRILGTEDMPFYYGALRRSLAEQAIVNIKNTKQVFNSASDRTKYIQDFIDNPPQKNLDIADLDAKVATFKNDTILGQAANSVRNSHPVVEFILPFAKTPSAVATAMFDYSPIGGLHTLYRNFIKGNFNQKDFAEGLGRAATGMGALWLGSQIYKKGKITLNYPKDEKTRAEWEATGKTPNSILIKDKWVPLVTFGPVGAVLGIGGYSERGREDTGSISGGVISGLFGGLTSLTEQTFLTGVKDLINAIQDPEKFGPSYTKRFAGSVVPTIVNDFAQAFDEYQRKPENAFETIKSRIPGVRTTVTKKLDVWGQPMERNRPGLATAISPMRLSNTIEGPLNTEVERLKELGEDIAPTKVDAQIKSIKLDDEEHYKYQRLYGNILVKGLTALVKNEEYQNLDPENQAELWNDSKDDIRKAVSDLLLPELLKRRYDFGDEIDGKTLVEVTNQLYKLSPEFSQATPEKQRKVILKILNKK